MPSKKASHPPGTPGSSLADQGDENLKDQDRATLERARDGSTAPDPLRAAGASV